MEIEYKWEFADGRELVVAEHPLVADVAVSSGVVEMHATYYDSADMLVKEQHGGLRVRRENEDSVCCLKLSATGHDGCKTRQEFEVEAADIREGLEKLPSAGAPAELCEQLLESEIVVNCETVFSRKAIALNIGQGKCEAELAYDTGELRRNGKTAPIHEVELEYKSGDIDVFHAYAAELAGELGLVVQPLSKLARAMAL